MTSILSTVSGYFSRALILGAFLPTIIFVVFFLVFVFPLLPADLPLFRELELLSTEWKVVAISFTTIVISGLLFDMNSPLVRMYEGYPWQNTRFGRWITKKKTCKYEDLNARQLGMRALLRKMRDLSKPKFKDLQTSTADSIDKFLETASWPINTRVRSLIGDQCPLDRSDRWAACESILKGRWAKATQHLINNYPYPKASLILPTRLGNVIRSFEYYPDREYGMDAIILYPRLIASIPKEYGSIIDDAKTSFDFMINCSALSLILFFLLVTAGVVFGRPFDDLGKTLTWSGEAVFLLLSFHIAYRGAINRAAGWGETVRSAFDLYRTLLLQQLGFSARPNTRVEERRLWNNISLQMRDGDYLGTPQYGYGLIPCAIATPGNDDLTVLKAVKPAKDGKTCKVIIDIRNESKNDKAEAVELSDSIPAGWFYRSGSAHLINDEAAGDIDMNVRVIGSGPYFFQIGDIAPRKQKRIVFDIVPMH